MTWTPATEAPSQRLRRAELFFSIFSWAFGYLSFYGSISTKITFPSCSQCASGQPGPSGADLVPGDLAAGLKSGYNFQMLPSPTGYMVQANPVAYLSTGRRSFYSDNSLTVRENWGAEPATPTSKEIK